MPIARLELSTDPSQLASLKAALEGTNVATSSEPSLITSIHYDTSDRKLHQHGLSLRIEQDDTHRVQVLRRLGLSSLLSDNTHIIILDPMLPLRPLGPLEGGEGRGEMGDSRTLVGTRLTLPALKGGEDMCVPSNEILLSR